MMLPTTSKKMEVYCVYVSSVKNEFQMPVTVSKVEKSAVCEVVGATYTSERHHRE